MNNKEKKAWLNSHSISGGDRKFLTGNLTLQNCHIGFFVYPEFRQVHIQIDRETLLLIHEAIKKEGLLDE